MYKHTVMLQSVLTIQTEEEMSLEELENVVNELDYEVTSEYGSVRIVSSETDFISYNKSIK